ncbi:MAG: C1 family peptidase [Muribaculaceae bacterium]|nr:C1 family peptidase [Muribaculaceae bacterium]
MKLHSIFALTALSLVATATAQTKGGISEEMINEIRTYADHSPAQKALRNAMAQNSIATLVVNNENPNRLDMNFSHRVPSKGITNQRSSGRCWLFTGLNFLRAQAMLEHDLPELKLSQNYNFFFDQLEKSNLFLQSVIDYAAQPIDSQQNKWLFAHALNDGGQFTGIADNLMKYGVVPDYVMPETYQSEHTADMRQLLTWKLREDGLELRKMVAEKKSAKDIEKRKTAMLGEIYRILSLNLGEPPTEFTYTRKDSKGNVIDTQKYTPKEFYNKFMGNNLAEDYMMIMNDPTRPYYKVFEIDLDRHTYDGKNWRYLNLPMEEIKAMAIESIKDSTAMYFSCDVKKFLDREGGTLDLQNYDYESLFGTKFGMDKAERIATGSSGSSHAMTLIGVNITEDGTPDKWLIENSWGINPSNGKKGHLIATDEWMDEYLFRLVVNKKYVPENTLKLLDGKATMLPAWDPMFAPEE